MKIDSSFAWNPAKEFLELAKEFVENNDQIKYQAMVILVLSSGIEAKIKEPFYKILKREFEEVSNAEFCPLLYALFLINEKKDVPNTIKEIRKTYKSNKENPEFVNFQISIQMLIQLRNQIAHGKFIVLKSTFTSNVMQPYVIDNQKTNVNSRFLNILEYIYNTEEYKNLNILNRKRPVFNKPDIEVIFEAAILKHFYDEVLLFYSFIDNVMRDLFETNNGKN